MKHSLVLLELPIRPGVLATVMVPDDLTAEEAARICRLIESLPIPSGDPWPELLP